MARARIGTSGWSYPHWRAVFYPAGLPAQDRLGYLSARLSTVEINASFHALQTPQRYVAWREATPADFCFAVKGSRFLTHARQLRDPQAGMARFLASGVTELGPKLGPMLWQLPARLRFDRQCLQDFLAVLPPGRHALEARHESFGDAACLRLLQTHGVALVWADSAGRFPQFEQRTADFAYMRLHGPEQMYQGSYGDRIDDLAERINAWVDTGSDVYAYFDNDAGGAAVLDAMALSGALQ